MVNSSVKVNSLVKIYPSIRNRVVTSFKKSSEIDNEENHFAMLSFIVRVDQNRFVKQINQNPIVVIVERENPQILHSTPKA